MSDRRYRDADWLREQYKDNQKTIYEIADLCDCSHSTVSDWLNKHDIQARKSGVQHPDSRLRDGDWLRQQYHKKEKTTFDIADICDCSHSTVLKQLHEHDVETREMDDVKDARLRDADWLRAQYHENRNSSLEIADECGCSKSTVLKWLNKHDIETRSGKSPDDLRFRDADWLRQQYHTKSKTAAEIADLCGCVGPTVSHWLNRHDIETRTPRADARLRDFEWLHEQYRENEKTTYEIADLCDCHPSTVSYWLEQNGIERRATDLAADSRLEDEHWLREEYHQNKNTTVEIAGLCDCHPSTVSYWLEKHGIEIRSYSGKDSALWEGGAATYGSGWTSRKRQAVRRRDGFECVRCGISQQAHQRECDERLHVHHLEKARDIDDPQERNAAENLVTLCRACHAQYEKFAGALQPQLITDGDGS